MFVNPIIIERSAIRHHFPLIGLGCLALGRSTSFTTRGSTLVITLSLAQSISFWLFFSFLIFRFIYCDSIRDSTSVTNKERELGQLENIKLLYSYMYSLIVVLYSSISIYSSQ
jgi:hypothetical protein